MLLKLIACNVFMREACACIARSPHVIDVEFTELGEHVHSATLRETIQARIDAADRSSKNYDAILLLFGICGNAGVGLKARSKRLVIPRAHDCCTILLGSRKKYREHFEPNPSQPFSSVGYLERGNYFLRVEDGTASIQYGDSFADYVERYGEDAAKMIWDAMHPRKDEKAVFIDIPETSHLGKAGEFRAKAAEQGMEYVRLEGSLRLFQGLIFGEWNPSDYLVVEPGQETAGVYDFVEIMRARPQE